MQDMIFALFACLGCGMILRLLIFSFLSSSFASFGCAGPCLLVACLRALRACSPVLFAYKWALAEGSRCSCPSKAHGCSFPNS